MEQFSFFDPVERSVPGARWWTGAYECRNWHGYFQQREGGRGAWQFVIYAFGEEDAVIYGLGSGGALVHHRVPMDDQDRLIINGCGYGRKYWVH